MKYAIIHIADIHFKKNEHEGVSLVLRKFVEDLKNQIKILEGYHLYLAITGDIVCSGSDCNAFEIFKNEFGSYIKELGLSKKVIMIVPGNHDIDRESLEKDFNKLKSCIETNSSEERLFNDFLDVKNNREFLNKRFENYELFELDFAEYGIKYSVGGEGYDLNERIGLYCLNTALCSFGGYNNIDDQGNLAIDTRSLMKWCSSNKKEFNLLLMHHPLEHFNSWSKKELKNIIEENFDLCLSGHIHEKELSYNNISQKSIICHAPQLFSNKNDKLGYSIILVEDGLTKKIIYRQFDNGVFLNGSTFSGNSEGVIEIKHNCDKAKDLKNIENLERVLKIALVNFKDQPDVFVVPSISKNRELNNGENIINEIIAEPKHSVITAPPQFGLTTLSHYLRLEAYKIGDFWLRVDVKHTKLRKLDMEIEEQLKSFDKTQEDINCIIIDSWDSNIIDHRKILCQLDREFKNTPVIVLKSDNVLQDKSDFDFNKLENKYQLLHLQQLRREQIREIVKDVNKHKKIAEEDEVVTKVVNDLTALNIHRTPLNCLTLLKVLDYNFNESLINRSKMIKTILFILFTDIDSFSYKTKKPEVEDCEFILGKFCMNLIKTRTTSFSSRDFIEELEKYNEEEFYGAEVRLIVSILEANNILEVYDGEYEFKHSYWIYYFASKYMFKNNEFKEYIFNNKEYVNYPEIIEFYTGIDGLREDAINLLLKDLEELIRNVNDKIGIQGNFNPYNSFVWNPSKNAIESIRKDITEKVKGSNLPISLKDQHDDQKYDSERPYNQTINKVLNEYLVISLMQNIRASSRALRNSRSVNSKLKVELLNTILKGWEQISRVIFWFSPILAAEGRVSIDGFGLKLDGEMEGTYPERLKRIYLANPMNVVSYLKDDLSSKKLGMLICENLKNNNSELQKHLLSIFMIVEKPDGWEDSLLNYMNLLHPNSYYIGNIYSSIMKEIDEGFFTKTESGQLKKLLSVVSAKLDYSPKEKKAGDKINTDKLVSVDNKLEIDKIMAAAAKTDSKQSKFFNKK